MAYRALCDETATAARSSCSFGAYGMPPDPCKNTDYRVLSQIKNVGSGIKFIVSSDTSEEALIAVASTSCSSRWCKLLIWENAGDAGTRFPLTDRQVATQVAAYTHNPAKGFEELVISGKSVPMGACSNR